MTGNGSSHLQAGPAGLTAAARAWLAVPGNQGRVVTWAIAAAVVVGLWLPPVSLVTRLTSIGYTAVRAGTQATVQAVNGAASLQVDRMALGRSTRARVRLLDSGQLPRQAAALPDGRELVADVVQIDWKGPRPTRAYLTVPVSAAESERAFIDPYGWDGRRWQWLAPQFVAGDRVRIELSLDEADFRWVAVTRASEMATELSVAVLPPPATIPAAVVELPILEVRAFRLSSDDGSVSSAAFAIGHLSQSARMYGIVDNIDNGRVRSDLVTNMLIQPAARQRNREALVDLARRNRLEGIVLDYRGIPDDLQPAYLDFVRRLGQDLHAGNSALVVAVAMPRKSADGWDPGPVSWRDLGASADALRVLLPLAEPLDVAALDDLAQWGLRQVERGRLQVSVPVQGRDAVNGTVTPISFGEALGHILDMARSDAPGRVAPGDSRTIDLPTLKAAGFGLDEDTELWRFSYWDLNRREHTVWLNDAAGLSSAFTIASRYRLGRLVLDGVEAGLDPAVWDLATRFLASGDTQASRAGYRLRWQLTDESGQTVQEAIQPLGQSSFALRAPVKQGTYRLSVNLVTEAGAVVALGQAAQVAVAPAPPATALPTALLIYLAPTPMPYATGAAPADEAARQRTPVRIVEAPATVTVSPRAAKLTVARAELRSGPDLSAEWLSDLRIGDVLEIVGRTSSGKWLRIRALSTGMEGWVLAELLEHDLPLSEVPVLDLATPEAASTTSAP